MIGFLLNLINPLARVAEKIADTKVRIAAEQNTAARIALEGELATLEARRSVILAAQADPFERWVRIGFALPFVLYLWKLVVWNKLLGLGATADLSANLWNILYIVLGGYFVYTVVRRLRA